MPLNKSLESELDLELAKIICPDLLEALTPQECHVMHPEIPKIKALISQALAKQREDIRSKLPQRISSNCWSEEKQRFVNYRPETVDGFNGCLDQITKILEGDEG